MTALPAISTALPSLGGPGGPSASSRRSGAPASQSSPLARSGSMRSSFSSPNQQQQQQQTSVGNLASPAGRSSRNSSSTSGSIGATRGSDAVASITDDILMHHVVPIIKARNMEGFLLWLKEAPNVNIQDFAGNTPLHWACHKGLPEFVAVLLRHEALKDAANRNGATPLHCAAISGVRAVVEILLQAGADPMIRNSHGRSFFDALRSKGHAHLLEVFEQLELKLLAREPPAQSTMADSWLDASRVGADSDSDDDGNRSHHDATPSREGG
ncbi:ankyrin repeat protein, putative [Bodo saltans]|uniref:Ankyrin repeat protein, putative n=1 Tax=Bodo saltans TaxID=75058 RepID=A0A0S4KML3_BODSA|nr:ankyrin repeat protein, putative [Bodo saltans]|eukprot:CUI14746.1 ankyrin repeat protein, putative [Bodo saltans]